MKIIFICIFFLASQAIANSNEYIVSSGTYHPKFEGEITNSVEGKYIFTPLFGYGVTKNDQLFYSSIKGFVGLNSIHKPIIGGLMSAGADWGNVQLGLVAGAYYQDLRSLSDQGIPTYLGDISPVIGFELNFKYYLNELCFVKLTNTVFAFMINNALSIGYNF